MINLGICTCTCYWYWALEYSSRFLGVIAALSVLATALSLGARHSLTERNATLSPRKHVDRLVNGVSNRRQPVSWSANTRLLVARAAHLEGVLDGASATTATKHRRL